MGLEEITKLRISVARLAQALHPEGLAGCVDYAEKDYGQLVMLARHTDRGWNALLGTLVSEVLAQARVAAGDVDDHDGAVFDESLAECLAGLPVEVRERVGEAINRRLARAAGLIY